MFLTTETSIPGKPHHLVGIVHATACRDGQFGTEKAIVKYTEEATEVALSKLATKATALGADGVIGVQVSVSTPSSIACVTIIGTAIKF